MSPALIGNSLDFDTVDRGAQPRALIDFEVTSIEVGNSSRDAMDWEQPNGEIAEYIIRDETVQINVTFTQAGTSSQPATADGWLQIWHPVGFIIAQFQVNMTLSGLQSVREEFIWTPSAAHSAIDENGYLYGGITLLGIIDGGLADDNDQNNELSRDIPVAVWHDPMDNGFCGDVDGDNVNDCPNIPYANAPIWVGAGYEADNSLSSDPDTYGHWRMTNASSSEGENHWRVSRPGADYASNRHDRLWWGWFTPFDSCDDPGHGLGYGTLDSSVTTAYGSRFCKIKIRGFDFISMHLITSAWGQMSQNDTLRIEADAASSVEYFDYSALNLSTADSDWSRQIWNMTGLHESGEFTMALKFDSDGSSATEGIHIDSFLMFAIQRVPEYTIEADCDDPLPNAYLVIPADPHPPSLHCRIRNNGYVDVTLRLFTEVSNQSWMYGYPLRIDSNNNVDHDNYVVTDIVKALTVMDAWFNLSIPDGAEVQEMEWYVDINDGTTNFSKASLTIPVSVQAAYSCKLEPVTISNPAATLEPGANGTIPMVFKNTGNQVATWNLGASFADTTWGMENMEWYDSSGQLVTSIELQVNEEISLDAKIIAPDQISPGVYEITLIASGRAPANFMAVWNLNIEVPVSYDIEIIPFVTQYEAPADGFFRSIEILIVNHGNSEESYDLYLDANWHLDLSLNTQRTLGITPFGGDTTVFLQLPMPYGIEPETYEITINARSVSDPGYGEQKKVYLAVPETHLVDVEDLDMLEEVFRGGDPPRSVSWEVTNNGNVDDAFYIDFEHLSDVSVDASNLVTDGNGDRTPFIPAGGSFNITVLYSFADEAFGTVLLQ